jgi:hypothetical protein
MQILRARGSKIPAYIGSSKRDKDDLESMLELGGNLFLQNASVNNDALNDSNDLLKSQVPPLCLDLLNYKYNYSPILFHENRLNREWRLCKHPTRPARRSSARGHVTLSFVEKYVSS